MNRNLLSRLKEDYPDLKFMTGQKFLSRPPSTILIGPSEDGDDLLLLHEVSHAVLGHHSFDTDVSRLKMEAEAWEKAKELAHKYKIAINEDVIQDELDTYRNWLHQKSRCPICGLTRFQTPDGAYHCPRCENFT